MSVIPATGSKAMNMLELMRPHQWVKNVFIFAAPMFARRIEQIPVLAAACIAYVVFCMAASAVYVFNDLADLERDRQHPLKKNRPIASGRVRRGEAMMLGAFLASLAVGLCTLFLPWAALGVLIAYLALNALYSRVLKHMVILDVMFIAAGFILRVLMGAFATEVKPSYWLLLCTLNVSLFLGFTKRRAELMVVGQTAGTREVLEHYSLGFLDQMIAIVTGSTIVCYILYTVDVRTVGIFGSHYLVATVPFVLYGVFRYLYLTYHQCEGGSPTRTMLKDRPFLVNAFLWALACVIIIYGGPRLGIWLPWR